jgi:tetratricopeptide (TPR) repeat protein
MSSLISLPLRVHILRVYRKDPDKAIVYWEQALQIQPTFLPSLEDLSIEYSEVGDYNMAFYHVDKLIEYHPDYGRGYYLKGVYLQGTGEDADAELYFQLTKDKGYDEEQAIAE